MSKITLLSKLLFIGGEALIVAAFMLLFHQWPVNVLILNIAVASTVWILLLLCLPDSLSGKTARVDGNLPGLGLRSLAVVLYAIYAVAGMAVMNYDGNTGIYYQLLYQAAGLFLLLCGLFFAGYTSARAVATEDDHRQIRSGLENMYAVTEGAARIAAARENIPSDICKRIYDLRDELRFISPCGSVDAVNLENHYCELIQSTYCMLGMPGTTDRVNRILDLAHIDLMSRKALRN